MSFFLQMVYSGGKFSSKCWRLFGVNEALSTGSQIPLMSLQLIPFFITWMTGVSIVFPAEPVQVWAQDDGHDGDVKDDDQLFREREDKTD
jgi:hypothetical protein